MLQIGHVLIDGFLASKKAFARVTFEVGSFVSCGFHVLLTRLPASRELTAARSTSKHGETVRE